MTGRINKKMKSLGAAVAIAGVLAGGATVVLMPATAFASHGADDVVGHVRHSGNDDAAGHIRQSRGADDAPGHIRQSRGADDAPGHVRHSGDDGVGHT